MNFSKNIQSVKGKFEATKSNKRKRRNLTKNSKNLISSKIKKINRQSLVLGLCSSLTNRVTLNQFKKVPECPQNHVLLVMKSENPDKLYFKADVATAENYSNDREIIPVICDTVNALNLNFSN